FPEWTRFNVNGPVYQFRVLTVFLHAPLIFIPLSMFIVLRAQSTVLVSIPFCRSAEFLFYQVIQLKRDASRNFHEHVLICENKILQAMTSENDEVIKRTFLSVETTDTTDLMVAQ